MIKSDQTISEQNNSSEEFSATELKAIEAVTQETGRYLFEHLTVNKPSVLQRRWWDDRIMAYAMDDEMLKVQLFRFIDVLPALKTSEAIIDHLHQYLRQVDERLPAPLRVAVGLARRSTLSREAVARVAKLCATDFAKRFIAGSNTDQVVAAALAERKLSRGFTLDILGEAVTSDAEAEGFLRSYIELIKKVATRVNSWPADPQIDQGVLGELPRTNLSVKLSALDCRFDAMDFEGTIERVSHSLRLLLRVAHEYRTFINIDMESYDKKDITLHIFQKVLSEPEFRRYGDVGIVIQCYLKDAGEDLQKLRDWAEDRGRPVWVRLVKGAYWDYETTHARSSGWPVPVFQEKWQSDDNFERQVRFLMKNHQYLRPALGSHNLRSLAHGMAVAEFLDIPKEGFEIQMLYGMADAEKKVLVDLGHRLRIYMPYGELIPGMAYLVRRLLENTSNDSFLRAGLDKNISMKELLKRPKAS